MLVRSFKAFLSLLVVQLGAYAHVGQEWPTRPIKWIVPFTAGSAPDIGARVVGDALQGVLKQPIVIENRPGAGGNVGTAMVARAQPDGYTWLYSSSPTASNMKMYRTPGYSALKDFAHISLIGTSDCLLVVNGTTGPKSIEELVSLARQNPGKLSYASGGIGTPAHIAMELFLRAAHANALHVPYKGAGPSTVAVITKEVDFSYPTFGVALPEVQGGRLRALATSGAKRNRTLPSVPTLEELGYGDSALSTFGGLSVPAGTPTPVIVKIQQALDAVLAQPAVRAKLEERGSTFVGTSTSAEYTEMIRREIEHTQAMMQTLNIQPQ